MNQTINAMTPDMLDDQTGEERSRFAEVDGSHHLALRDSIERPGDVALEAVETGPGCWTVTVCLADAIGALSVIAGLFSAYRLDITSADLFTIHRPRARSVNPALLRRRHGRPAPPDTRPPSRLLLDIFEVRTPPGTGPETWSTIRSELTALAALLANGQWEAARDEIVDRISPVLHESGSEEARLLPVSIELENDPGAAWTKLTVRSTDSTGFLFAFTNALAGFTINIQGAELRTNDGEVTDVFWITDVSGKPITGEKEMLEVRVATALIKQFTHLLPLSPNPGQAIRQFNAMIHQMLSRPGWTDELANLEAPAVLETLASLMGVSRFLWEDFLRIQYENLFPVLVDVPALQYGRSREDLETELRDRFAALETTDRRVDALNAFKDREMFRIDLRHITGRSSFEDFAAELSMLAEVVMSATIELGLEDLVRLYGSPRLADGSLCPWTLCALGKFGGAELGFGSDLEIILVYQEEGRTDGPGVILASEYYGQLVQRLRKYLRVRQEGIFEIDLRLRPFGKAGPLASSLAGFREYYSPAGAAEQFERMALIRLRPVAGDAALAAQVVEARDAFVYSDRPMDIANIRHLRHRQATELVPRGELNAKYSAGGLVDVEYFVQTKQVVAGRTDPKVRITNTLEVIQRLVEGGHIAAPLADQMRESYVFLRRLIDALRVVRGNAKDLSIPVHTSRELAYLAQRLRFDSIDKLETAIRQRMAVARGLWDGDAR